MSTIKPENTTYQDWLSDAARRGYEDVFSGGKAFLASAFNVAKYSLIFLVWIFGASFLGVVFSASTDPLSVWLFLLFIPLLPVAYGAIQLYRE